MYLLLCFLPHAAGNRRASQLGGTEMQFRELDLNRTLSGNGIHDESEAFEALNMAADHHVPVLHVYWNDDLTQA
jgi:TPP-dependent pyruvate/acetoin dehydrogenase alpha subunit